MQNSSVLLLCIHRPRYRKPQAVTGGLRSYYGGLRPSPEIQIAPINSMGSAWESVPILLHPLAPSLSLSEALCLSFSLSLSLSPSLSFLTESGGSMASKTVCVAHVNVRCTASSTSTYVVLPRDDCHMEYYVDIRKKVSESACN